MKTYEEAVSIVAEVRLSGDVTDFSSAFNWTGAMLLAKIYEKGQHEVANDCYDLYMKRRAEKEKAIKSARAEASRAENEARRLANIQRAQNEQW